MHGAAAAEPPSRCRPARSLSFVDHGPDRGRSHPDRPASGWRPLAARLPAPRARRAPGRTPPGTSRASSRDGRARTAARLDHGDARPASQLHRHEGRPPLRARLRDEPADPRAAGPDRPDERADARAREGPLAPAGGAPASQGPRRLRRAPARRTCSRTRFPRDKYELQYGFKSGERVDAVDPARPRRSSPSTRSSRSTTSSGSSRPRPTPTASCTPSSSRGTSRTTWTRSRRSTSARTRAPTSSR